jgi:hypothetical protein
MKYKYTIPLLILTAIMATISCSGGEMEQKKVTYSSLKDIPDAAWEKLSKKKIYFGHQSVGFNIIDGVQGFDEGIPQDQTEHCRNQRQQRFQVRYLHTQESEKIEIPNKN